MESEENFLKEELGLFDETGLTQIISGSITEKYLKFDVLLPNNLVEITTDKFLKFIKDKTDNKTLCILLQTLLDGNQFILKETDENIQALLLAILFVAIKSNCIKNEYKNNCSLEEKEYKKENKELFKKTIAYIPAALNALNFSTINFIRFNHHFPDTKKHLIKKAFLPVYETFFKQICNAEEDVPVDKKFYEIIVPCLKIVNELVFFYVYIKPGKFDNKISDLEIKTLGDSKIVNLRIEQPIITIRSTPTTNQFLILDILNFVIQDLNERKFLPVFPYIEESKTLLKLRKILIEEPFKNHPSRFYFGYKNDSFITNYQLLVKNMEKLGNFLYLFCQNAEDSLKEAKSPDKYKDKKIQINSDLIRLYNEVFLKTKVNYDDMKNYLKNQLKLTSVEEIVNNNKDIKDENEKIHQKIIEELED
jgi:hypothetical protein